MGERYVNYNPNPAGARVGDCVIRALSKALGQDWEKTYAELYVDGLVLADLPSANHVWGSCLKRHGFKRRMLSEDCPDCYTVEDFCREHNNGLYVLAISGHVVTVVDGQYYDAWDSGNEIPLYYWGRG